MTAKLIGQGLQYKVFEHDEARVLKVPNSRQEQINILKTFGIVEETKVRWYLKRNAFLTPFCFKLINKLPIDKKYFARPEFLSNLHYTQEKLIIPAFDMEHSFENILKVTEDFVELTYQMWSFGLHDRVMKLFVNCGYNKDFEFVFCDFGEFTCSKKRTTQLVKNRHWQNSSNIQMLPEEIKPIVIETLDKAFTIERLNLFWKSKL